MTPEALTQNVGALVTTNRDQDAFDLTSRCLPQVRSMMTAEHAVRIAEVTHVAQMAVDLEEWDAANRQAEAEAQTSRLS